MFLFSKLSFNLQPNFVFPFKICAYFAFFSIIGKTFYNPGRVTDLVVSQIEHERQLIHFSWTSVGDQLTTGTGNIAYILFCLISMMNSSFPLFAHCLPSLHQSDSGGIFP